MHTYCIHVVVLPRINTFCAHAVGFIFTKLILIGRVLLFSFWTWLLIVESKKEDKDQESIQSTSSDPRYQWESDNVTIRHHKREPRGQPFPSR